MMIMEGITKSGGSIKLHFLGVGHGVASGAKNLSQSEFLAYRRAKSFLEEANKGRAKLEEAQKAAQKYLENAGFELWII